MTFGDTFSIEEFVSKIHDLGVNDVEVHNTFISIKKPNFLFSEDCLRKLSYPISLEQSTNKLKITPAILDKLKTLNDFVREVKTCQASI